MDAQLNGRLLYRASRDGPLPDDFFRCCAEKGPTLTIVKVAGTGYVFGAYTAISWRQPTAVKIPLPDPSGSSFLFSLTNAYGRPFRMSLADTSRAISVGGGHGPCFGSREKRRRCNLMLMGRGLASNAVNGNASSQHNLAESAYHLDPWVGDAPRGFTLNYSTLAGTEYFVAEEIEVYAL